MPWNKEWIIFVIGLIPFFAAYWPAKAKLDPVTFVAVAFLYLVVLRFLTRKFVHWLQRRNSHNTQK